MSKKWTVYIHTNKINGKVYIGQTCQKTNYRWLSDGGGYLKKYKNGEYKQPKFAHAIEKYGWDNFEHIIFAEGLTQEEANHVEELLIALYNTTDKQFGYNCRYGGNNSAQSEETKRKISAKTSGKNNPMYGREKSELTIRRTKEANSKAVYCVELCKVFESGAQAAKELGLRSKSSIYNCLKRRAETAGGYHWMYYDEYLKEVS